MITGHLAIINTMLGHGLDGELSGKAESKNIHVQHPPPVVHLPVHQRLRRAQTSVVDAHVHPAQVRVLLDPVEHLSDLAFLGDVASTRVEPALLPLQLLGEGVYPLLPASAPDHLHLFNIHSKSTRPPSCQLGPSSLQLLLQSPHLHPSQLPLFLPIGPCLEICLLVCCLYDQVVLEFRSTPQSTV